MAAALVQSKVENGANDSVSSRSVTLNTPATANNLLVAVLQSREIAGSVSTPSGWTRIADGASSSRINAAVFYKVAAGGESTITVSYSPSAESVLAVAEYSGLESVSPLDASSVSPAQNQASATTATATPTTQPGLAVSTIALSSESSSVTITTPTDYTTDALVGNGTYNPYARIASLAYSALTGQTVEWTYSGTVHSWAVLALFKEPSGAAPTVAALAPTSLNKPRFSLTF